MFTFRVVVREQLDVKLFSKSRQVRRHDTAGCQVDLITAGLHLVQIKIQERWSTSSFTNQKRTDRSPLFKAQNLSFRPSTFLFKSLCWVTNFHEISTNLSPVVELLQQIFVQIRRADGCYLLTPYQSLQLLPRRLQMSQSLTVSLQRPGGRYDNRVQLRHD